MQELHSKWTGQRTDKSSYATFYRTYSYAILVLFLIYLGYLFSFFYFIGFGNIIEEVGLIRDKNEKFQSSEEILTEKEDRRYYNLIHWAFP